MVYAVPVHSPPRSAAVGLEMASAASYGVQRALAGFGEKLNYNQTANYLEGRTSVNRSAGVWGGCV